MSTALHLAPARARAKYQDNPATRESAGVRLLLLVLGLGFFGIFLLLPLVAVFTEALRKGWELYFSSLADEETFADEVVGGSDCIDLARGGWPDDRAVR